MSAVLLDLGNSRWKIGLGVAGRVDDVVLGGYDESCEPSLLQLTRGLRLDRLLVASVKRTEAQESVVANCERTLNLVAEHVVSRPSIAGVRSGYRNPEQLGVDRLMAMVAARHIVDGPVCVIDAGTAATIDCLDDEGQHLGGVILPGLQLARECLLANTAIPAPGHLFSTNALGRDTASAIAIGARMAVAGVIDHLLAGEQALLDRDRCAIVYGGGDAAEVGPFLPRRAIRVDQLVLQGLAVLADRRGA